MRRADREKIMVLQFRIKELEQILCPGENHEWKHVSSTFEYDGVGESRDIKRYVCQRCLKARKE